MERRRLVLAFAALLTVAALGFTAAAVDGGQVGGGGDETDTETGQQTEQEEPSTAISVAIVTILVVVAAGGVAYSVYTDSMPWWLAVTLAVALVVLLALVGLGYVLELPEDENRTTDETATPDGTPSVQSGGESDAERGDTGGLSTTAALVLLGVMLVAGVLAVARFSGAAATTAEESADDQPEAIGEAAGRAADELGETTLSNAIYRAWHDMTDALDVEDPETTTPAEFEDAAVEAGIDRADVATLTDLFREVRYGDAPATPEREQRAREALRRIETAYAEVERETTVERDADEADTAGDTEDDR